MAEIVYLLIVVCCLLSLWVGWRYRRDARSNRNRLLATLLVTGLWLYASDTVGDFLRVRPLALFSGVAFLALVGWGVFRHYRCDAMPAAHAAIMDKLPDAVFVVDGEGRLSYLNPAARRLLNLTGYLPGQSAKQLFADWPEVAARISHADERQMSLRTQDNPPRYLDGRLSPLYKRNGAFCGQILLLRDVTARKMAEERYHQLLECNPLGISVVETATGLIVYANKKAADLVEIPRERLIGSAALSYYADPKDRERITKVMTEQGQVADYELHLKTLSGREIWCLVTSSLTVYDGRQCHISSIVDITERKQTEDALRFSQFVIDHMPDAVFWVTEDGHIFYVNQAACRVLGYSRAELLTLNVPDIDPHLPPSSWATHWLELKQCGSMTFESQKQRKNGEVFPVEVRTNFVRFKNQEYACGIVRDISKRKQTERILQAKAESEAIGRQQRAILDNLPVGAILTVGIEQKVVFMNPRFVQMFGYTFEQVSDAAHWWPLAYPDPVYRQQVSKEWNRRVTDSIGRHAEVEPMEVFVHAADGTVKYVSVHLAVLGDLNVTTFIDLTERQQAEEARRERDAAETASKSKSRFLANISHEIRTPLNAILGFAQVLERETGLNTDQRDMLATIRRSGKHLLELINDILDMAKIEAGQMTLQPRFFDLGRLVMDMEALFRQSAYERGLELIIQTGDLPGFVEGDEMRLRQVLINLLSNAIKFTPTGAATLQIEAVGDGKLRFSVTDTGMGIAGKEMAWLFEPFSQTASGRRIQEGTGLGLALSRQFVRLMGGELEVRSVPGEGSEFFFTLPLRPVQTTALPATTLLLEPGQAVRRILILDVESDNRATLRALLASFNPMPPVLEFREAEDDLGAIAIWETWQPHLVFMDMRLPRLMPGKATARQIKARMVTRPGAIQTSVVALTADLSDEDRVHLLACGCDELAHKPFRAEELFEILQRRTALRLIHAEELAVPIAALSIGDVVARLAQYPNGWRDELRTALDRGDSASINKLIEPIAGQDAALYKVLAKWAYDCDHEAFIAVLES